MDLFLTEHALTHAPAVADPNGATEDPFARGLTDGQLRLRPAGLNSVAWNIFHVARTEPDQPDTVRVLARAQAHHARVRVEDGLARSRIAVVAGLDVAELAALRG